LDEEQSLLKTGGHTRRIARPHFGRCCPHKQRAAELRPTTSECRTRVSKWIEVDGGNFERLL